MVNFTDLSTPYGDNHHSNHHHSNPHLHHHHHHDNNTYFASPQPMVVKQRETKSSTTTTTTSKPAITTVRDDDWKSLANSITYLFHKKQLQKIELDILNEKVRNVHYSSARKGEAIVECYKDSILKKGQSIGLSRNSPYSHIWRVPTEKTLFFNLFLTIPDISWKSFLKISYLSSFKCL